MAGATIEFEDRKALAAIGAAVAVLRSPDAMLRDMGEALMIIHRKRFQAQTSPDGEKWQALSPAYQRRKKKNRDKILTLEGYLRNTLRYQIEGGDLFFGTDRPYGAIHQFGGKAGRKGAADIPPRPWLGIGLTDAEKLEAIAKRHLDSALGDGRA